LLVHYKNIIFTFIIFGINVFGSKPLQSRKWFQIFLLICNAGSIWVSSKKLQVTKYQKVNCQKFLNMSKYLDDADSQVLLDIAKIFKKYIFHGQGLAIFKQEKMFGDTVI